MSGKEEMQDKESQLLKAYFTIVVGPFQEIYEDMWEEEAYWEAVEAFKAESKKIGFEDPCEALNLTSFEAIRAKLMAGPMLCFRKGWKSPFIGEKVDMLALVEKLHHASGPKFEGKERIVIIEFWATWCGPCLTLAPKLSDIYEANAGRVAAIGLNNDDMFDVQKEHNVGRIKTFIETKKESLRYPSYVDTEGHLVRDSVFKKFEYKALPCIALLVDNVTRYVGGPRFLIEELLGQVLEELYPIEE